jgi:hypothetical protein
MRILLACVSLLLSAVAALADPVGTYTVSGTNPGSDSAYSGKVTVEQTGDTYKVVWVVGSDRFTGTGIGNSDFMAVTYRSGDHTGLALYAQDGDGWKGVWTYAGGKKMGTEHWERE